MSHPTRVAALKIASYVLILFGLLMLSSLFTPTSAVLKQLLDLAFLSFDAPRTISPEAWLLVGIAGGILAGWGVTLLLVAKHVFASDAEAGRAIILPGIFAWFVVDGAGSILAGAWFNAVMNAGFLALFAVPLLWPARADRRTAT